MSKKADAFGRMCRDESIVSHPYAGLWRLVAATGVHEECPVVNEKLAIPHQNAWLAGRSHHLANTADPAEGVTLNIAADRTFCETLTTAHPNLIWFDAAGVQIGRNNFAPLYGVLKTRVRADGHLVGYLTLPGRPGTIQTSAEWSDDIVLRCALFLRDRRSHALLELTRPGKWLNFVSALHLRLIRCPAI